MPVWKSETPEVITDAEKTSNFDLGYRKEAAGPHAEKAKAGKSTTQLFSNSLDLVDLRPKKGTPKAHGIRAGLPGTGLGTKLALPSSS